CVIMAKNEGTHSVRAGCYGTAESVGRSEPSPERSDVEGAVAAQPLAAQRSKTMKENQLFHLTMEVNRTCIQHLRHCRSHCITSGEQHLLARRRLRSQ